MENGQAVEALSGLEQRRQRVAAWVQSILTPPDYELISQQSDVRTGRDIPEFEVRDYQLDAWVAIWEARQAGKKKGLTHLATGLGKTSIAVFDVIKFREEFRAEHGHDPKVMFTVHQNDILEQAADRFRAFIPEATIGFYTGKTKDISNDITFATFQSLHTTLHSLDPKTFDYIIDDEVHHAKAHTFEKVVKHFKPKFRLGLTATPNRADDKDIREIYGSELYSKGLAEALSEGWLATPDYHIVFDDAVKEVMQSGFQANSLKALKRLFDVKPRNDMIADNIRSEMKRIGLEFGSVKTIVFCQDIEHAEEMAEQLGGAAYHSEVDDSNRKNIFDEFKNGDLQVITTRDMFNEGVDVPDARLLVFLRSTSSQTIFEQQLGRGLRKAAGKERVSVLDFVANVERIAMVKDLAEQVKKPKNTSHGSNYSDNELNEDNEIFNSGSFEATEDGFVIHTNHGEFDFDKMVVDLLERYQVLKQGADYWNPEKLIKLADEIFPNTYATTALILAAQKEGNFVTPGAVNYYFGTLEDFNALRGLAQPDTTSKEYILEQADKLYPGEYISARMIEIASRDRLLPSVKMIAKTFGGSLIEFNAARGFVPKERPDYSKYTNDELIELANDLAPTKLLSLREIKQLSKDGKFMGSTSIVKRFGSINHFNAVRGFDVKVEEYSKENILIVVQETYPGQQITADMIKEASKKSPQFPSYSSIRKNFDSITALNKALKSLNNSTNDQ